MIKNFITLIFIFLFIPVVSYSNLDDNFLEINGIKIEGYEIYNKIDKKIDKKSRYNLENKKIIYSNLIRNISVLNTTIGEKNTNSLKNILIYGYKKNLEEIDIYYSKVHKITLGYTQNGKEIFGYYKGNPTKGYFGIFANIHGGYEYGSYNTALHLLDKLKSSEKSGWFIIPTINPEGLDYYLLGDKKSDFYVKGRPNSNNVDINRNFCTQSFELKTFIKNGEYLKTGIGSCGSEKETQTIIEILQKFKFNKIISIHSEGNIFYIPENSFDDIKIRIFGSNLHKQLPSYDFDLSYENEKEKNQKIYEYEVDEGGSRLYTGTMETYIYEKYNIPVILLELEKHGQIDYKFEKILNLIK